MKYTCPKCGKIIELSTEALIASEYFTVCPQCLTRLQIVGNYAYVPVSDRDLDLTPPSADNTDDAPTPSNEKQPPAFSPATTVRNAPTVPTTPADDQTAVDPLLGQAINFVSQCNAITPVMLSSHFNIPIERAQVLITQLEQAGVIGPYNGGAPRSILIPHRTDLPGPFRVTPVGDDADNQTPNDAKGHIDNKTYTFTCSGCLTWFIVVALLIFLLKQCA